jgi:uncharacterized membrane protein YphA (DoxX/SURF4 family)
MATTNGSLDQRPSRALNISLWVVQVILAGMFVMAGLMKSTKPIHELSVTVNWANDIPELLVRFIGVSELLGGLGLLLPGIFRIKPVLTPIAASGLVTVMVFAMIFHISRGEYPAIGFNLILALLAAFVAWGRFKKAVIPPK